MITRFTGTSYRSAVLLALALVVLLWYNAYTDGLERLTSFTSRPFAKPDVEQTLAVDALFDSYGEFVGTHETNSFKPPRTAVHSRQCQMLTANVVNPLVASLENDSKNPVVFHLHDGKLVDEGNQRFKVGAEFCSVFIAPQSPRPQLKWGEYQNLPIPGWGPDLIHGEMTSTDVRLMFEPLEFWGISSIPDNKTAAVYTVAYGLYQPGHYQVEAEIEFQHYDWVMEDEAGENHFLNLRYRMKDITVIPHSPDITIFGAPASRPTELCFENGNTDHRGRWFRASSFDSLGKMTAMNPAAHLEYADHDHLVDEWGWTFAPDLCTLVYFSPEDHMRALEDANIEFVGESNSRRLMKSIIGGGVKWCQDKDDLQCQCDDNPQLDILDPLDARISTEPMRTNGAHREVPMVFGYNTTYWNDYIGGLMTHPRDNSWKDYFTPPSPTEPTVIQQRVAKHGAFSLVHLSLLAWDIRDIQTPSEALALLPSFRQIFLSSYTPGTRFVTRLANGNCCGTQTFAARFNMNRFAMWNEMWRRFWADDEEEGLMVIYDASVLQGRKDASKYLPCWQTHMRGSHVRLEQMLWMNAVAEKGWAGGEVEGEAEGGVDGEREGGVEDGAVVGEKEGAAEKGRARLREWRYDPGLLDIAPAKEDLEALAQAPDLESGQNGG